MAKLEIKSEVIRVLTAERDKLLVAWENDEWSTAGKVYAADKVLALANTQKIPRHADNDLMAYFWDETSGLERGLSSS